MKRAEALSLLTILCVVVLCVAHVFGNGFVYDDLAVIKGPLIHHPERLPEVFTSHAMLAQGVAEVQALDTYRPVSIASFFWDAWLSGEDPWSYHLTNLLAHLASVIGVFLVARNLVPEASVPVLCFASLFFGLSPQLAEGHVWINGRSDPLATMFGLTAILFWRARTEVRSGRGVLMQLAAATTFLLGLLCKEVLLLTTPSLFFWPSKTPLTLVQRVRNTLAFSIPSVVYLALRMQALHGMKASAWPSHASSAALNLPILWADGLLELVVPTHLYLRSMRDEYAALGPTHRYLMVAGVVVVTLTAVLVRRRAPVFSWSILWYGLTLAPAVMIASLVWPGFGRYLYLPCAGFAIGLCEVLAHFERVIRSLEKPFVLRIAATCLGLYLAMHAANLVSVTRDYENNQALYGAIIREAPGAPHGYGFLGISRLDAGYPAEAVPLLEQALRLGGFEPRYTRSLIRSNMHLGNIDRAAELARDAVNRTGGDKRVGGEMRSLLMKALALKSPVQAMGVLCECLALDPLSPPCLKAPQWMLDPSVPTHAEFRKEFDLFARRCLSKPAVAAFEKAAQTALATYRPPTAP